MNPCLFSLMALMYVQDPHPASTSDVRTEAAEIDLLARIELPARGNFTAESSYYENAVPAEVRRSAADRLRAQLPCAWRVENAFDAQWMKERPHLTVAERPPLLVQGWSANETKFSRSDAFVVVDGASRVISRERVPGSDGSVQALRTERYRCGREVIFTNDTGPSLPTVTRDYTDLSYGGLYGAFYVHARFCELVLATFELARANDDVVCAAEHCSWYVDLTRPTHRARLAEHDWPRGLTQTPCTLYAEFRTSEENRVLLLEWRDVEMALLAIHRATWTPGAKLPVEVVHRSLAPGTTFETRGWTMSFTETNDDPAALEPPHWIPKEGQRVIDQRFDPPIGYDVGPNGALPSDDDLQRKSVSLAGRLSPTETRASVRVLCRAKEGPPVAGNATIDLGPATVGGVVKLVVHLRNEGAADLDLDQPVADCGCIASSLLLRRIPSGAELDLELRQQIARAGGQESAVRIPVLAGGAGPIEIRLKYFGVVAADPLRK